MASAITTLLKSLTDGAADGTGIAKLVPLTQKFLGSNEIPAYLIAYVEDLQQAQFGSYPDSKDVAPSAIFIAIFVIFFLAHTYIYLKDMMRGHHFPLSLGFAFYCCLRWIGFTLRLVWAKDIMKIHVGIGSAVLLVLPTVFLASFNLVLAQRVFTWKHPVYGNNSFFWFLMIAIYSIVTAVVLMTIVAGVIPYLYFLSESNYNMCKNVVKVSCVLICLYSLLSLCLTFLAFVLPTTKREKEALVYQPFWIKSFGIFYFPPKGAADIGEETFIRHHVGDMRYPNRTILGGNLNTFDYEGDAAAHKAAGLNVSNQEAQYDTAAANTNAVMLEQGNENTNQNESRLTNLDITSEHDLNAYEEIPVEEKFKPRHNLSLFIIALTSLFVFIGAIFRCIALFIGGTYATESWICKPVVMYVMFGALETIVNALYLVFRVDLRFYRADALSNSDKNMMWGGVPNDDGSYENKDASIGNPSSN